MRDVYQYSTRFFFCKEKKNVTLHSLFFIHIQKLNILFSFSCLSCYSLFNFLSRYSLFIIALPPLTYSVLFCFRNLRGRVKRISFFFCENHTTIPLPIYKIILKHQQKVIFFLKEEQIMVCSRNLWNENVWKLINRFGN